MPPEPAWAATYLEAAGSFADLVGSLPAASLAGPGLGEWDLRSLVGHTSRSLVTVSEYLRKPAPTVELESAVDYVAGLAEAANDPGVTRRGVEAGERLGDDPAGAVRLLLDAATADLARANPEQLVTTYAGGMRLRDYLPTRTFELVVHCLDIAAAVPARWTPPAAALSEAVQLAAEVAVRRGEGALLLRLVTGREPGGLSIV
ncbi:MAG TPA: maleylpyruvate isomerase N-terminal domain-containing protein [Nocardioides sp.]|nr:maleylpyruvate isomerase N-terminal domain-containing protein [Nocardioides sp.]